MYYVELLRAKRALVIAGVILAIVFVVAAIVRASLGHSVVRDIPAVYTDSDTAHVTRTKLADGSQQIVVDDPKKSTHAVILQRPNGGFTVDAIEPNDRSHNDNMSMGSFSIDSHPESGGRLKHTTIAFTPGIGTFYIGVLFLITIPIGLLMASMLGGALAKENDGHLDLAWTKPVTRERFALTAFGIDCAAIVFAQLGTIVVLLLASLLYLVPSLAVGPKDGWYIALSFFGPVAWYALITVVSASFKRSPGGAMGLLWLVATLIPGIVAALEQGSHYNTVAAVFYAVFKGILYLNPIAYLSFSIGHRNNMHTLMGLSLQAEVGILAALIVGYLALSLVQWRRVEA